MNDLFFCVGRLLKSILRVPSNIIGYFKGIYYTKMYANGEGKIVFASPFIRLNIQKTRSSKLILDGNLILSHHIDSKGCIRIHMDDRSKLHISNNFSLGEGVAIFVQSDASLEIGGQYIESASGITCNTQIMCYRNIKIGTDLLCSWNVFITDADWHTIYNNGESVEYNADVQIGNHCWIGSNVIIGKGTNIGENCIIPAYSKLAYKTVNAGNTFGGFPPKVFSEVLTWKR